MESGAIKDSQITVSSETAGGTRDQSRLNAGPEKAWCVNEMDPVRTLTIDLQREYSITQVKALKYDSLTCLPNSAFKSTMHKIRQHCSEQPKSTLQTISCYFNDTVTAFEKYYDPGL